MSIGKKPVISTDPYVHMSMHSILLFMYIKCKNDYSYSNSGQHLHVHPQICAYVCTHQRTVQVEAGVGSPWRLWSWPSVSRSPLTGRSWQLPDWTLAPPSLSSTPSPQHCHFRRERRHFRERYNHYMYTLHATSFKTVLKWRNMY